MKSFKDLSGRKHLPFREQFYRGSVLRLGQIVEDDSGHYEIVDRGTNYVTVVNESGKISKKFVDSIHVATSTINFKTDARKLSFKGLIPSKAFQDDTTVVECFQSTIKKYESGIIDDSIAILKAISAVDYIIQESISDGINKQVETEYNRAVSSLNRIGELDYHQYLMSCAKQSNIGESMDNIKATDKIKVAAMIADTLGVDSTGSSPEGMVNNALRNSRKNSMAIKGESLKIIMRMLELAKSVGIKYDVSIIKPPESLEEVSAEVLKAAAAAKHKTEPKSLLHVINRFKSAQKTQDKLHKSELKRISGELKEGVDVSVDHPSGKTLFGKVKGKHGSVVEVQYKNGKVSFHHSHKVQEVLESDINTLSTFMTYADIVSIQDNEAKAAVDDNPKKEGHTLGSTSETHRKQLLKHLKDI